MDTLPRADRGGGSTARDLAMITLLGLVVLLPGVFRLPLVDNDESRCALIVRSMIEDDNWIEPRLEGEPYYKKPPLFFWLSAVTMVAGLPVQEGGRLVSVAATIFTALLVYDIAHRLRNRRTGLLAAAICLTGTLTVVFGRLYRMDMLMVACLTLSMWAFVRWEIRGAQRGPTGTIAWWVVFYVGAALGTLAKGPVVPVLATLIAGSYLVLSGQWRRLSGFLNPIGLVVYVALVVPWFLIMHVAHPDYVWTFFVKENVGRYGSSWLRHVEPAWFYVPVTLLGLAPWSAFLGLAARESFPCTRRRLREDRAGVFLWTWVLMIVVFFTVAQTKLVQYILPALPALAVIVAGSLEGKLRERARQGALLTTGFVGCVIFPILIAAGILIGRDSLNISPAQAAAFSITAMVVAVITLVVFWMRVVHQAIHTVVLGVVVLTFAASVWVEPGVYARQSSESLGKFVGARIRSADIVGFSGSQRYSFLLYAGRDRGLSFDGRSELDMLVEWVNDGRRVWVHAEKGERESELRRLTDGRLRVVARAGDYCLMSNAEGLIDPSAE